MLYKVIKIIIPTFIFKWLKEQKYKREINREYSYLRERILHYSSTFTSDLQTQLASLMIESHVLEKGITMPNRRLGFGNARVRDIINSCKTIIKSSGGGFVEVQAALRDLKQYRDLHAEVNYQLPDDIVQGIEELLSYITTQGENRIITREDFFKPVSDFADFAKSRHSIRWFSDEPVDEDKIIDAIHLAQTAPSACNRQATHVKIISSEDGKKTICAYHNGSRGFGEKADKWLLVTTELRAWRHNHADIAFIDAGIFTMNLLYALHYYGLVSCPLNAHFDSKNCREISNKLGIPPSEYPVMLIAIGNAADQFMVPQSARLNVEDIIQKI